MAEKHIKAVIQIRRGTETEWYNVNPVLHLGEPAYSTDVRKLKVGNGTSTWRELTYLGADTEEILALVRNLQIEDFSDGADYAKKTYFSGSNGIVVENGVISLDELIIDCGESG